MRSSILALLLLGCPASYRAADGSVEGCEPLEESVVLADVRSARLAVRGDAPLLGWTDDSGAAVVGGPDREDEVLAIAARAIDVAPTTEGFVAAVATEGAIRVVEIAGDERRSSAIGRDTRRSSVGAAGAGRLVAFDVGTDSSALAFGAAGAWEVVPLGRVRGVRVASDGTLAAAVATGFDGLAMATYDGARLGEVAAIPGDPSTSVDVDVAGGGAWVVGATVDASGLLRVEAHRWDGAWGEAEAVATLDAFGEVSVAAGPEPRVFVGSGALRAFVRRDGAWVEEGTVAGPSAAFPSATGDGSRWGVAWQDADRRELLFRGDGAGPRPIADGSDHRLPQLVLGERCLHVTWSEWTGAGYRSWYWRGS